MLASWISTSNELAAHWDLVNVDLGSEMVLQGDYNRAGFIADPDIMPANMISIVDVMHSAEMADVNRDTTRSAIRQRVWQFRAQVGNGKKGSYEVMITRP